MRTELDVAPRRRIGELIEIDRVDARNRLKHRLAQHGAAEAELLESIRECVDAELWRLDGASNAAEWVAGWADWSVYRARKVVQALEALDQLPHISEAHRSGALCLDKIVELARFATPETERKLVRWARQVSPGRVRERATEEVGRKLAEVRSAYEALKVEMYSDDDHWHMHAQLSVEDGARVEAAIRKKARKMPAGPQNEGESEAEYKARTMPQREADAFVTLMLGDVRPPVELVLHAPVEKVGDDEAAFSFGGGLLHAETVRRLSCDCELQIVLEDGKKNPLGAGDRSRNIPRKLRRAMLHRDGHQCRFPGCERKAEELAGHHIQHWVHEGETELPNLVGLCPKHHWLVHEGGWSVTLHGDRVTWFRPGGRIYDPGLSPPQEPKPVRSNRATLARAAGYSRAFDLVASRTPHSRPSNPPRLESAKLRRKREQELMRQAFGR